MSRSASKKPPKAVPKAPRLPLLRTLAGLGILVIVAGSGAYYVMNRPAPAETAELDEDEELSLLEATEFSTSREQPQRLPTATMNDVVAAVHQESSSDASPSSVIPARHAATRPESNPAAWLNGTIEADSEAEPSVWPHPATGGSQPSEFNRFTRK